MRCGVEASAPGPRNCPGPAGDRCRGRAHHWRNSQLGDTRQIGELYAALDPQGPPTEFRRLVTELDKVALGLVDGHAHTCAIRDEPDRQDERTEERVVAIGRLLRRD